MPILYIFSHNNIEIEEYPSTISTPDFMEQ